MKSFRHITLSLSVLPGVVGGCKEVLSVLRAERELRLPGDMFPNVDRIGKVHAPIIP